VEVTALIRFRVLVDDIQTPKELKNLFELILPDEEQHTKILADFAGFEAMKTIRPFHEKGLSNLGIRLNGTETNI